MAVIVQCEQQPAASESGVPRSGADATELLRVWLEAAGAGAAGAGGGGGSGLPLGFGA